MWVGIFEGLRKVFFRFGVFGFEFCFVCYGDTWGFTTYGDGAEVVYIDFIDLESVGVL